MRHDVGLGVEPGFLDDGRVVRQKHSLFIGTHVAARHGDDGAAAGLHHGLHAPIERTHCAVRMHQTVDQRDPEIGLRFDVLRGFPVPTRLDDVEVPLTAEVLGEKLPNDRFVIDDEYCDLLRRLPDCFFLQLPPMSTPGVQENAQRVNPLFAYRSDLFFLSRLCIVVGTMGL